MQVSQSISDSERSDTLGIVHIFRFGFCLVFPLILQERSLMVLENVILTVRLAVVFAKLVELLTGDMVVSSPDLQ